LYSLLRSQGKLAEAETILLKASEMKPESAEDLDPYQEEHLHPVQESQWVPF
jgi:hypothetical protein